MINAQKLSNKEKRELLKKQGWIRNDSLSKSNEYVIKINKFISDEGESEYINSM